MLGQIVSPLRFLASWLGGWSRLILLVLAIGAVVGGLYWERQRHPPLPPQAQQVTTSLMANIRQTTFQYPGSADDVRTFYQQMLLQRGWRYCGTQATPNCTNLIDLIDGSGGAIDVYRRAEDREYSGPTIEIWPQPAANGQLYVTLFETSGR